jgi:hypothetical protein
MGSGGGRGVVCVALVWVTSLVVNVRGSALVAADIDGRSTL